MPPTDTGSIPFPDGPIAPWPADPETLFPDGQDCFWYQALIESEGPEDFGYRFLCEWFIHGLSDNWWILIDDAQKQLDPKRFEEWLRIARDAFDFGLSGQSAPPPMTQKMRDVLQRLARAKHTMTTCDMAAEVRLSRKTVGILYSNAKRQGLIDHPHGERKGAILTEKGRRCLSLPSSGGDATSQ